MEIQLTDIIDMRFSEIDTNIDDLRSEVSKIKSRLDKTKDEEKRAVTQGALDTAEEVLKTEEARLQRMEDEGDYDFNKRVLMSFRDNERIPPYFFTWVRYEPSNNYREFREAKVKGWRPVLKGEDFWPSPLPPDENGYYLAGDVIFMRKSLKDYIMEKIEKQQRNINLAEDKLRAFNDELKSMGASIPDGVAEEFSQKIFDSQLEDYKSQKTR